MREFERVVTRKTLFVALLAVGIAPPAPAHPVYMDHIEHHVKMEVGPTNIDVTIELRFNELRSLSERRRMDADRDGLIGPAEQERYLRRIGRELRDGFQLRCRGEKLDLVELYEPRLDLLDGQGVSPTHHVLRLYYFARTPGPLTGPVRLEFEDRTWPSAPSLWFFRAYSEDGFNLRVDPSASSQPAGETEPSPGHRATITIVHPPVPATRPAGSAEIQP